MGNGKGLELTGAPADLSGAAITPQDVADLNKALTANQNNFGAPTVLFSPANLKSFFQMTGFYIQPNPQYNGTEWAYLSRVTPREHAFAKLQCFLLKFKLQKHLEDEDERRADSGLAIKRLKHAKWARYKRNKVKSSP